MGGASTWWAPARGFLGATGCAMAAPLAGWPCPLGTRRAGRVRVFTPVSSRAVGASLPGIDGRRRPGGPLIVRGGRLMDPEAYRVSATRTTRPSTALARPISAPIGARPRDLLGTGPSGGRRARTLGRADYEAISGTASATGRRPTTRACGPTSSEASLALGLTQATAGTSPLRGEAPRPRRGAAVRASIGLMAATSITTPSLGAGPTLCVARAMGLTRVTVISSAMRPQGPPMLGPVIVGPTATPVDFLRRAGAKRGA